MDELISASLERVATYFASEQIKVGPVPSFTVLNDYSPWSKKVIAQVPGQMYQMRTMGEKIARKRFLSKVPQHYENIGLNISLDSLEQYLHCILMRSRQINAMTDEHINQFQSYGTDMLFYKSVQDILEANEKEKADLIIDVHVAHEFWHVIEMRHKVLDSLIVEGTAEYARVKYEQSRRKHYQEAGRFVIPDLSDEETGRNILMARIGQDVYHDGLMIVSQHAHELKQLLYKDLRTLMENDLMAKLDASLEESLDEDKTEEYGALIRFILPEFNVLDNGITKENLLYAHRQIGAYLLAKNLESQDCTKLLEEYKALGYGKKAL